MASRLYNKAREKFLTAQLSWLAGEYKAILLPAAFDPDFDDEFVDSINVGTRIATSIELTGRTATNGLAMCDPISFGILVDPRLADKMIIFQDTGDETSSALVAFIDEADLIGAPLPLVGLDYFYIPSQLQGGVFRL